MTDPRPPLERYTEHAKAQYTADMKGWEGEDCAKWEYDHDGGSYARPDVACTCGLEAWAKGIESMATALEASLSGTARYLTLSEMLARQLCAHMRGPRP